MTILETFLREYAANELKDEIPDILKGIHNDVKMVSEEIRGMRIGNEETPPRLRDFKARFSVPSKPKEKISVQNYGNSLDNIGLWYQIFSIGLCETVAAQLTYIDWKNFSKINISELINKRWLKKDKTECPFYWKYVSRFNKFNYWL